MAAPDLVWKNGKFGQTSRRDNWWSEQLLVLLGFGGFIVYATWAAFQGDHYTFGPYLSPFYSPELFGDSPHSWFGPKPGWWPEFLPFSPALFILPFPGLFRFTCYYYRGAYYKAFWGDPPACAVSEPRNEYRGEHKFPLIFQNIHRYFFYIACLFILMLGYDAYKAMWWDDGAGGTKFGIGLGTILLVVNVCLIASYTLGCHSARHLAGGVLDRLSESPIRKKAYEGVSCLNGNHKRWAWCSLFSVAFSDIYVRCCSMGIFTDLRIL